MKKEYLAVIIGLGVFCMLTICAVLFGAYVLFGINSGGIVEPIYPIPTITSSCGLETCHGLDVKCGTKPVQMCTEMYSIGDRCLRYVKCGVVNGACTQIDTSDFNRCKTCVETCTAKYSDNIERQFACESQCE
jgi:hypothetical protein